jgi:hypothetical protein
VTIYRGLVTTRRKAAGGLNSRLLLIIGGKDRMKSIYKILLAAVILLMPYFCMAECCCKKIVEYTVASAYLKESFIEEVERLIKKGYQPFKGIQVHNKTGWMYQIMVRYEE